MRLLVWTMMILGVAVALTSTGVRAQTALPDVDVILVAEVEDVRAWAALHQETLASISESKLLRVTLPAATGGSRSIIVYQPKFTASVVTSDVRRLIKIGVTGKIRGAEALATLTSFEIAAVDVQAGAIPNDLGLAYGLTDVDTHLLELHLMRP